jgi:ABC-2 type transport system ATP-binding protein
VLAEVSQTADDVVVISKGRSVAQSTLTELIARSGGGMKVVGPDVPRLADLLRQDGATVSENGREVIVRDRGGEQIGRLLAEHQLVISELAPVGSSLEEVFFELTGATGGPS